MRPRDLDWVRRLQDLRTRYNRGSGRRKLALLRRAGPRSFADAESLRAVHDTLLFLVVHPDNAEVLQSARAELLRIAGDLSRGAIGLTPRERRVLQNSGIAGTSVATSFSLDLIEWLLRRFPRQVEVSWSHDGSTEALEPLLPLLSLTVERDGLLDTSMNAQEWVELAGGSRRGDTLATLLGAFRRLGSDVATKDHLFDSLHLDLHWKLGPRSGSRTFVRFPQRPTFYQVGRLMRETDPVDWMDRPLPAVKRLAVGPARSLIDVARVTLAIRGRETDPVTYANPREVALVRLERGIDVALFGMHPERRLPVESFFGFLAARNRVPVAYGGGWIFFDRAEIGINIFDEFRGGESAFLFSQVLRVYRQHYRVQRFLVDPFQFGAGNTEGIRSGAFWFYYRLGFRPVDERLRARAHAEWERICANRAYRVSSPVLRRLTQSRLLLLADHPAPTEWADPADEIALADLGLAVTRWVGKSFRGDRRTAGRSAVRTIARRLGVRRMHEWPPHERQAFERLSPLIQQVPRLQTWTAAEKAALVSIMRAKGGPIERNYVLRLQQHRRLHAALALVAQRERTTRGV